MKKEYSELPSSIADINTYGFSWMEFITAIPAPLFVVTSFKSNRKANACLQSWACFSGSKNGYYAILSQVNRNGHMYRTIKEGGVCVINFPSAEIYDKCIDTIKNNQWKADEITASGLSWEAATAVDAPRIVECFLALECRYMWERSINEEDDNVLVCLNVLNVCMEEAYLDESVQGRYGDSGYIYNLHYPINPENYNGKSRDSIAVLKKIKEGTEY